ncbi:MAG: aminotransferase class I/II-fold pyridoxal phosphate-dependent enzyme [Muribaculaceae bacterium]|nr:aminotransferase class I/II-fold pyridoxal phosphate-dependent enzyme [Muribaculaceae bacterium]
METKRIAPAERISAVSEYYFSRKLKEIARLNAAGADIISLGIGGPDLPPPPAAVQAAVETLENPATHSYQMTVGLPELRRAYAGWYDRWYGISALDPDTQILPLIGSKEGVLNVAMAFVNPGDAVLVPNPGYPTYTSASRLAGARVLYYDLPEENGWEPDFEALERMPLESVKIMWVNYPHMPTGHAASRSLFERLVDFGRRHGILIVNDNPYSFIRNSSPLSIMQVPDAADTAMEMNSLSKCLNMAGWRLGMLIGKPEFISWVLRVKSNIDSGQPRAMMMGAIAALTAGPEWYAALNAEYERRAVVAQQIMDTLGCHCAPGQQGLFLWGRIPDTAAGAEAFTDRILVEARVFITPGFIFGSNGERYIRISLCEPVELLQKALQRIKDMNKQ